MNTETIFSSKTDEWETPKEFFDILNLEFDFEVDVCALPENAKCEMYYTPEMDGSKQDWKGRGGMPFSGFITASAYRHKMVP